MEITGSVVQILPEQGGQSKSGNNWRKQDFILETNDQYPKKVCISMWGDKIDQFGISEGQTYTVSINVESREFNGRWYTDVKAWRVQAGEVAATQAAPLAAEGSMPPPPPPPSASDVQDFDDDLPF